MVLTLNEVVCDLKEDWSGCPGVAMTREGVLQNNRGIAGETGQMGTKAKHSGISALGGGTLMVAFLRIERCLV